MIREISRRLAFQIAISDRVEKIATGHPPLRDLAWRWMARYVGGAGAEEAMAVVARLRKAGIAASVDLFGENEDKDAACERTVVRYLELCARAAAVPGTDIALDCSHLGLDADPNRCAERVCAIAAALPDGARLQVGAEESSRADAILGVLATAANRELPVMATLQANLRRSGGDLEWLLARRIPVRLVKGAYAESTAIAHPWGPATDSAFLELASRLADARAEYALATHDPAVIAAAAPGAPLEFLLGVRTAEAKRLTAAGRRLRVYVPFGPRWFRYGARRLAESLGA